FAVQIAKARGARVIATGSAESERLVRNLGADVFVDYQQERFEDVAGPVDAVLDPIGGDTQARSWKLLGEGGTLASTVGKPSEEEARARGARSIAVSSQPSAAQLEELARLFDDGTLRVIVSEVLPLAEARRAQEESQSGHAHGQSVLR